MRRVPQSTKRVAGRRPQLIAVLSGVSLLLAIAFLVIIRAKSVKDSQPDKFEPPPAEDQLALGGRLYENYCLQCHGEKGQGDGPAARYLSPKPRNFTLGNFRIVTTENHIPSDDDLVRVISRDMPGSAMFSFEHLAESDRQALAAHVRHLTRAGIQARIQKDAEQDGEQLDSERLEQLLDRSTRPGKALAVSQGPPAVTAEAVTRGHTAFLTSCAPCHGATGKGDGVQVQFDDARLPTGPRDFTRGIFKGGREPQQLRARIVGGMPGSPMPGYASLTENEVNDLLCFILSISDPAGQAKVEHHRGQLLAKHTARSLDQLTDEDWSAAPALHVVVTPLWWRTYEEPDLQAQALHDGRTVSIRLSWHDSTRNDQAIRPQDFEDMAAVQLFKGSPEPFLGMGATDRAVDVWLWRASWRADPAQAADVQKTYPNMVVDSYPFADFKEFITARAAGNPQADPARGYTGSRIQAKGFGTATMRPRTSQLVHARGDWKDNRWTVVLRRPLEVSDDGGISLMLEEKASIAFALWDGAQNDRNGQKLVSVWHDLKLE